MSGCTKHPVIGMALVLVPLCHLIKTDGTASISEWGIVLGIGAWSGIGAVERSN